MSYTLHTQPREYFIGKIHGIYAANNNPQTIYYHHYTQLTPVEKRKQEQEAIKKEKRCKEQVNLHKKKSKIGINLDTKV